MFMCSSFLSMVVRVSRMLRERRDYISKVFKEFTDFFLKAESRPRIP